MLSPFLLRTINYSFAKKLHAQNLRRYFKRSQDNLFKAKEQMQKRLQIPAMSDNLLKKVFKEHPKVFIEKTKVNQRFQVRVKLIKELSQKYQLAKVMLDCIYKNQYILFKMSDQQVQQICIAVQQNYEFTKDEINTVFGNYYRTINPKLLTMLDQKIQLFHDYLHLTKEQTVRLFVRHHFLIPASLQKLKQTIVLLLSQSNHLGDEIMSRERIIQFLNQYPETFILGRHQIKDLIDIYKSWGIEDKQIWKIILQNPILLNNFPNEVMPLKKKLFRYFRFTKEMGRLMINKYPLVLMSSISSLQAKLIFIKDRLKLPINQKTLQLLQYKFSDIRPRGQLLVRAKQNFTLENIIQDYIKISDEEFARKLEISLERLKQQKQRFKETEQLDFRRRKVLNGSGVEQKIKGIINQMRSQLPKRATI